MKIVLAIDGDLLVSSDETLGIQGQTNAVDWMARQIGVLVKAGHQIVIIHGNAPQVGYVLLRGEAARHVIHALPLDICGADTQGATGYMLQQSLRNWMEQADCYRDVSTLITQVLVEETESRTDRQTKGIGPFFDQERAFELAANRGWELAIVPGLGYQRVVPCLIPKKIMEINAIRMLFEHNVIVVCSGGGGIPISIDKQGFYHGVEAVVDKAYTVFLAAEELDPDLIVFVSPTERIIRSYNIVPTQGLQRVDIGRSNDYLEGHPEMDDTSRHKLIASRNYLMTHSKNVMIVPPDQLSRVPDNDVGIQFLIPEVNIHG